MSADQQSLDVQRAQSLRHQAATLLAMAQSLDGLSPHVVTHEHRHGIDCALVWAPVGVPASTAADGMGWEIDKADGDAVGIRELTSLSDFLGLQIGPAVWSAYIPAPGSGIGISVSVDGGLTFVQAREGVRVRYEEVQVPGEGELGELHINHSAEGIVKDLWVTREDPLDHNIATSSQLLDDLVTDMVEADA